MQILFKKKLISPTRSGQILGQHQQDLEKLHSEI